MENTLHITRSSWIVERPHATGSDWGPGRYATHGQPMDAAMVRELETVHLPYYRNAGFRIVDKRQQAAHEDTCGCSDCAAYRGER